MEYPNPRKGSRFHLSSMQCVYLTLYWKQRKKKNQERMCKCQRNHCLALQLNEFHRNSFASLGNIQRKQFQKICLEIKVLEKIEFACNCFFFVLFFSSCTFWKA